MSNVAVARTVATLGRWAAGAERLWWARAMNRHVQRRRLIGGAIAVAMLVAACGGSPSSSPSGHVANIETARLALAPYIGHPSAFPVNTPLRGHLPAGTRFAYLQCSTPACGLFAKLLAPAVRTIGGTLTVINAGSTASSEQPAASSVLASRPAAALLPGITASEYGNTLRRLDAAGIKVTAAGILDPGRYGITFSMAGRATFGLSGKLMADWVIANKGAQAHAVFYTIPELDFSAYEEAAFDHELAKNCPSCTVRSVKVPVTTFGTTAPSSIVDDLQAHPDTNVAVFGTEAAATGLPAALRTAGISITTVGQNPTPGNLQDIKTGGLTAGLALDVPVMEWTLVDGTARLLLGDPLLATEQAGEVPMEFLTQKDITFDPSNGWTGYPDFPRRFAKLWHEG
jgi:ribose transport system substrate-binding protein